jgi:hypothetical protein
VLPERNPKVHHFVQRAYLEGFQDPRLESSGESYVWVYIPGKSPFRQRPDRVARRNYYYCYDDEEKRKFDAEHSLQELEDLAQPALRKLRNREISLSAEDRLTFAGYVALSHTRVPTFERRMNRLVELLKAKELELTASNQDALRSVVEAVRKNSGEEVNVEEFRKKLTGGTVEIKQQNRGWTLNQMFKMLQVLQEVIYKMQWTFLFAPEDDFGFLTSDNPLSLFDPIGGPGGGIGFASSPAAHFIFPVSRGVCLLAQHQSNVRSSTIAASQVRTVNKGTIVHADSQLYAPFNLSAVQSILDRMMERRPPRKRVLFKRGKAVEE